MTRDNFKDKVPDEKNVEQTDYERAYIYEKKSPKPKGGDRDYDEFGEKTYDWEKKWEGYKVVKKETNERFFDSWWKGLTIVTDKKEGRKKNRERKEFLDLLDGKESSWKLPEYWNPFTYEGFKVIKLPRDYPYDKHSYTEAKVRRNFTNNLLSPQFKGQPKMVHLGTNLEHFDDFIMNYKQSETWQKIDMAAKSMFRCRDSYTHALWLSGQIKKYLNLELYQKFEDELWKIYQ